MAHVRERADVELFALAAAIAHLAAHRLEHALPDRLSLAGLGVLNRLALADSSSPNYLASAEGVSKAAMTNTLQRLEAAGLIAVAADPADGRRKRISLTAAGAEAQRAALARVRPRLESLRAAFAPEDFEAALPFLRRLRDWLAANL